MKKIFHVHFWDDIRNTAGSVEKIILTFARNAQNWQHVIACCPRDNVGFTPYDLDGVKVFSFCENRLLNRICNKWLRLDAFTYPELVRLVERERPDVLHIHNRQDKVDQLVDRLNYRPKVVVQYHRHFRAPIIPRHADVLVYPSDATRAYFKKFGSDRKPSVVVHNPLTDALTRLACAPEEKLGDETRPLNFLFGGGANPVKGGKELLQAFLGWHRTDVRLMMVGNGAEMWANCGDSRINAIGGQDAETFLRMMAESDVVLMPSFTEAFGLIAQEAMFMGKLLVTSRVDGLVEVVPDWAAVVVCPEDTVSVLKGLEDAYLICRDPARYQLVTERARAAVQEFAPKTIVARLENTVYEGFA